MIAKLLSVGLILLLNSCALAQPDIAESSEVRDQCPTHYTSWGIDEYELFDLNKKQLDSTYKDKLYFSPDYTKAQFYKNGAAWNYSGPAFKLTFKEERVTRVQRCFGGCCKRDHVGPVLQSKKEALEYAIEGLAESNDKKDRERLEKAKNILMEME